jgi:hypothetical protein
MNFTICMEMSEGYYNYKTCTEQLVIQPLFLYAHCIFQICLVQIIKIFTIDSSSSSSSSSSSRCSSSSIVMIIVFYCKYMMTAICQNCFRYEVRIKVKLRKYLILSGFESLIFLCRNWLKN